MGSTQFEDLPDAVVSNIFSLVSDVRTRNRASLVCRKWLLLERSTRTRLSLRGNVRDLYMLPSSFRAVTDLDLSLLSPWGHPLLPTTTDHHNDHLISLLLRRHFPSLHAPIRPLRLLPPLLLLHRLHHLDLSCFYSWPEDLPSSISSLSYTNLHLTHLDLLSSSSLEGFKSHDLLTISSAFPNLLRFLAVCTFDPRYIDFVGDDALLALSLTCPNLTLLHLADPLSLSASRPDSESDAFAAEDARITAPALEEVFRRLTSLEELVLDVGQNVRDSGHALEALNSNCLELKSLKLGHFHGVCSGVTSKLDGVAVCKGLECLSLRNCGDLTDSGLMAIALGCSRLKEFEVHGCKNITEVGVRNLAFVLSKTLVDVKVSSCKKLDAGAALRALEPIRSRVRRLHIDCVWRSSSSTSSSGGIAEETSPEQCRLRAELPVAIPPVVEDGVGLQGRGWLRPHRAAGEMDLSLWDRFFLNGIGNLSLYELDYWPPQDRDVNQRSLSLPAAGLIAQCSTLRKLFIHGTAYEHFLMMLLRIPDLRDVQLREDYYPAPEDDMSTEVRVTSCSRFEDALNRRMIND
ncbi:hypothetical protein Scep_011658 [Stephania cephalantha]|uniref:COI1 F-box domain-containing protein n=1 Tax=Stephania cephalantha TaxID=152367 RepID=A0AAP0P8L7_9MAGN